MFEVLATVILIAHLLWLLWVVLGAAFTRGRPWLAGLHVASLGWGVFIALSPWPCPLTLLEQYLQAKARVTPYHGPFLMHYTDALVYPDLPDAVLTAFAVGICALNLALYVQRFRSSRAQPRRTPSSGFSA